MSELRLGRLTNERSVSPPRPLSESREAARQPVAGDNGLTGADGGSMTDPRASTALRHLTLEALGPPRWSWAVAELPGTGRLRLPDVAREVLDYTDGGLVSALAHGDVLIVRPLEGTGRRLRVDGRGRIYVPRWLRSHDGLLIGALRAERLVLVAPSRVLDAVGDRLLGSIR